jgi:putative flippase GtrA
LKLLTALFALSPFIARLCAIALAMVVAWLSHRRLTFRVKEPASLAEFLRYVGVAWSAAALNYAIFSGMLLAFPALEPLIALVTASLASMTLAYIGMRFAAFRKGY